MVDLEALAVVQTIDVGDQPLVLRLGPHPDRPDGQRVHVSNRVAGSFVELVPVVEPAVPPPAGEAPLLNEVVVLGMIHGGHETSEAFSLQVVRDLVRAIDPDYWLTEIPPNRWDRAWAEYRAAGTVEEPRVRRFPEYMEGLFPLSRELDDTAYDIRMRTYSRLFDTSLGPGGWVTINRSHWANIERALDRHRGEGARFLLTYGAGHKGPFLRELRQRDDIVLLDVGEFLDGLEGK